ncbi:hypothetical protein E5D57_010120 [Metarhizium anisopliae]|nr:hypothetical protein E5D57_010120 [Metarhizium anisopliae]
MELVRGGEESNKLGVAAESKQVGTLMKSTCDGQWAMGDGRWAMKELPWPSVPAWRGGGRSTSDVSMANAMAPRAGEL